MTALLLPCSMSHAPSLPHASDILPWKWRSQKLPSPRQHVVLPPFKQLDIQVTSSPPPTTVVPRYAPVDEYHQPPSMATFSTSSQPKTTSRAATTTKWYEAETPAPVVAERTAEMVCYLWFSSTHDLTHPNSARAKSRSRHSPTISKLKPSSATLQFTPSARFVQYVQKILETTQVSQSVIVLSLHYIFRLRQQNCMTAAQEGSEFRVAVIALMLANKFVDDNTYTNKTWSEVAGIELLELNRMEREFLTGIDSRLYVDKATYDSWLQLLKGLVLAKERERTHWQRVLRRTDLDTVRHDPVPRYPGTTSSVTTSFTPTRPRSSSPLQSSRPIGRFTFTLPSSRSGGSEGMELDSHGTGVGAKRSARAAFADDDASYPIKRPITLQTDGISGTMGPRSAGPSFMSTGTPYTEAFSRLSISSTPNRRLPPMQSTPSATTSTAPRDYQMLAQPCDLQQTAVYTHPHHLYFYTLSGSPTHPTEEYDTRKSKLRYVPLQSPTSYSRPSLTLQPPLVIQSATASPHDLPLRMNALPYELSGLQESSRYAPPPPPYNRSTPQIPPEYNHRVPAAYFANAGPPGVQWTATTPVERTQHFDSLRLRG